MSGDIDWIEEGKKHFLATVMHPERLCKNYPTQDRYSPEDETRFITGFNAAQREWNETGKVHGLEAYVAELTEERDREK